MRPKTGHPLRVCSCVSFVRIQHRGSDGVESNLRRLPYSRANRPFNRRCIHCCHLSSISAKRKVKKRFNGNGIEHRPLFLTLDQNTKEVVGERKRKGLRCNRFRCCCDETGDCRLLKSFRSVTIIAASVDFSLAKPECRGNDEIPKGVSFSLR